MFTNLSKLLKIAMHVKYLDELLRPILRKADETNKLEHECKNKSLKELN